MSGLKVAISGEDATILRLCELVTRSNDAAQLLFQQVRRLLLCIDTAVEHIDPNLDDETRLQVAELRQVATAVRAALNAEPQS